MSRDSHHQFVTRGHRSLRRLVRSGVILLTISAASLAPAATFADPCGGLSLHAGLTPTQRSIVLQEGKDPAHVPATYDGLTARAGLSSSQRSIALIEGRDPGNLALQIAAADGLSAGAELSPFQRSIVLAEGQDPAHFPTPTGGC